MASLNTITTQKFFSPKPTKETQFPSKLQRLNLPLKGLSGSSLKPQIPSNLSLHNSSSSSSRRRRRGFIVGSMAEEMDVIPVQSSDCVDQQDGVMMGRIDMEMEVEVEGGSQVVSGFVNEGRFSLEGAGEFNGFSSAAAAGEGRGRARGGGEGWTFFEILRYAPQHNWDAYEEALKSNPVFAKMVISGVVYTIGDWIAQCYEGKPLLEFDRARAFRSGLVGFLLHGSLSHYYYQFCEALFPSKDWWVVPAKVVFDQTAWSAVWNSIYYGVLGLLRRESPDSILAELKATFWPMITAGWKLWPFAHLITYGAIPLEQRLLWVDCVELIWVTILSTYSNEKSEARHSGTALEPNNDSQTVINKWLGTVDCFDAVGDHWESSKTSLITCRTLNLKGVVVSCSYQANRQ
ncbi:hypothetical protein Sjap_025577 [Stephania japonica]|uniref:Peroxisomal membrane protein n=1 Tax=Stephania japonica TaxID=461633 RepID=A0AAP0E212_9MAGN